MAEVTTPKPWFLYLVECTDGSLYTGITTDVEARYRAHLQGKGARYTRSHPPARLLGWEPHPDRSAASKAEFRVKQLNAADKRSYAATLAISLAAACAEALAGEPQDPPR